MKYSCLPLLALAACAGQDEVPDGQALEVSHTEQIVTLAIGEQRDLPAGVTLGVTDVPDDSRCPPQVQCVWAGSAAVAITLRVASSDTAVTLNSGLDPRAASFRGWLVRLREVSPGPGEARDRYRVTLGVTRE